MARIISGLRIRSLKYEIMEDMARRVFSACAGGAGAVMASAGGTAVGNRAVVVVLGASAGAAVLSLLVWVAERRIMVSVDLSTVVLAAGVPRRKVGRELVFELYIVRLSLSSSSSSETRGVLGVRWR